ncbi:hypothetical protein QEZ54_19860 [Catellatospora sp. KI3]|uniref:hypothetical protein n=1 Tax=Catellatospora sp. KI3 TaxID=3041620 RepID=UPI002482B1AE|nr:hypothetical protein [Catellatospora sp. KI3]MDI1463241.1 hypothetical protein [Catellatospora sp. KI3]
MRLMHITATVGAAALCAALFAAAPAQANKNPGWGVPLASFDSQAECQDALPYYASTYGPLVYCAFASPATGWAVFGPGD